MPLRKATVDSSGNFYQTAVNNGFTGTPQDLLVLLAGTKKVTNNTTPPDNPEIGDIWVLPVS